jgi:ELWxxDGT repeat protein
MRVLTAISIVLCLGQGLVASAGAQTAGSPATLIADLPGPDYGGISWQVDIVTAEGGVAYFVADDGLHGYELWRTDGTAAGTRMVADIFPGWFGGTYDLFAAGNDVFFTCLETVPFDMRLWRSDGSNSGTLPGPLLRGYGLCHMDCWWRPTLSGGVAGDLLYFTQESDELGKEMWVTDGSVETLRSLDLCPGPCSSSPWGWTALDERALFVARGDLSNDYNLWVSDGTEQGTAQLLEPGTDRIQLGQDHPAQLGDAQLFRIVGESTSSLWRTDGSRSGTRQIAEWDRSVGVPSVVGDVVYLGVESQIWKTDGTTEGTSMVAETGSTVSETKFLQAGAWVLFTASSEDQAYQLWRTDGTADGTEMVMPLGYIGELTPVDDSVMFPCTFEGSSGFCVSDGTAEGTQQLLQLDGKLVSLGRDYGALIFSWSDSRHDKLSVQHTDGTISGTRVIREIRSTPVDLSLTMHSPFHDRHFFSVRTDSGPDLWVSDGTTAGTRIHTPDVSTDWQQVVGDRLFTVVRYRGSASDQLCVLDEPDDALEPIADVENLRYPTAVGDWLFFVMQETPNWRLWTSDGTARGTRPVSLQLRSAYHLAAIGDRVFLLGAAEADDTLALYRVDIWRRLVRVAELPEAFNEHSRLVTAGHNLYIYCPSSLVRSDGTTEGTVQLELPFVDVDPYHPAAVGEDLLLLARRQESWELWRSDGDHFFLVDDLTLDGQPAAPIFLRAPVVADDRIFFPLLHQSTGQELWVSDGTPEGTRQLRDIYPGPRGSYPSWWSMTVVDGALLFAADNGVNGYELWMSDGSRTGTRLLADIAPGRDASTPYQLMPAGPMILFTAADRSTGVNLWAIPREALQGLSPRRPRGRTRISGR